MTGDKRMEESELEEQAFPKIFSDQQIKRLDQCAEPPRIDLDSAFSKKVTSIITFISF